MNESKDFVNSNNGSRTRFIYLVTGSSLCALFFIMLYRFIVTSIFDQDLVWLIPMIARKIEGASFIKLIGYFVDVTSKWFPIPSQKLYTFFVLSFFGPLAKDFIFVSIFFHFCNALLLFLVCKELKLSSRISFLSSSMYLTFFAHFHAYIWPFSFLHLIVIFFALLGLLFYLKTDKCIIEGVKYRNLFLLTLLVNFFASFCRFSILILPAMIMSHILFCSKDNTDRIKKYDIWLPLFIIYLFYPLVIFASGELRILGFFNPIIPFMQSDITQRIPMGKINIPIKFSILFLLGIFYLLFFRVFLIMCQRYNFKRILKRFLLILSIVVMIYLVSIGGVKRLLIPYNFLAPFIGTFATFFHPLQSSLSIDSTLSSYFIPFQLDVFNFAIGLLIIIIFLVQFVLKNKSFMILGIWYSFIVIYLYFRSPLVSRYFIFLSPVFCIVFGAVLDYLATCLINSMKLKINNKEIIIVSLLLFFCFPNLLAIKLALFRGKMVNTFLTYDYVRAANLIKQDITKNDSLQALKEKGIYVNNIIPLAVIRDEYLSFSDVRNDNVRFIFMQTMQDASLKIKINQTPQDSSSFLMYSLQDDRVNNIEGKNINRFSQLFEQALEQLKLQNYMAAMELFDQAIEEKPFLFKYILGSLLLDDLEWITNESDMRTWINNIGCLHTIGCSKMEVDRTRYILSIINKETDEYIQCFFYLSYLKYTFGDIEQSKSIFSKIRFLESDFQKLNSLLGQLPLVKSNKGISDFLDRFDNTSLYRPLDLYRDRYKFEKFLFNLAFKT